MATIDFGSLVRGFVGEGWPQLGVDQVSFLASQPRNKKGWHFYQLPEGLVVHLKTGLDYRNPSVPFQIVKVNGFEVISHIAHSDTYHGVTVSEKRGKFRAYKEGKFQYMPETWVPRFPALEIYRRFFSTDFNVEFEMTEKERIILWAANLDGQEEYMMRSIEDMEQSVRYIVDGLGSIPLADALRYLEQNVAGYICHLQGVKTQVEEWLSFYRL